MVRTQKSQLIRGENKPLSQSTTSILVERHTQKTKKTLNTCRERCKEQSRKALSATIAI